MCWLAYAMQMDAFANDSVMSQKAAGLLAEVESSLALARNKLQELQAQLPPGIGFDSKGEIQVIDPAAFKASLQTDRWHGQQQEVQQQEQQLGHSTGSRPTAAAVLDVMPAHHSTSDEEDVVEVVVTAPRRAGPLAYANGSTHANGHSQHFNGHTNGSYANGHSHTGHANGVNGHRVSVSEAVLLSDEVSAARLIKGNRLRQGPVSSSNSSSISRSLGSAEHPRPSGRALVPDLPQSREPAQPGWGQSMSQATTAATAGPGGPDATPSTSSTGAPAARRRGRPLGSTKAGAPSSASSLSTTPASVQGTETVVVKSWTLERPGSAVSLRQDKAGVHPSHPAGQPTKTAAADTEPSLAAAAGGDFVPSTRSRASRGRRDG
jgi:hypothetical protein